MCHFSYFRAAVFGRQRSLGGDCCKERGMWRSDPKNRGIKDAELPAKEGAIPDIGMPTFLP